MEGTRAPGQRPYDDSKLLIRQILGRKVSANEFIRITLPESNDINAYCGSPSSVEYYDPKSLFFPIKVPRVYTSVYSSSAATVLYSPSYEFEIFPEFFVLAAPNITVPGATRYTDPQSYAVNAGQRACSAFNDCSGHGACDYCYQRCHCVEGYGSSAEDLQTGRNVDLTCSKRTISPPGTPGRGYAV